MKTIYQYSNYKDWIKEEIKTHAEVYGIQSKLAEAAGCQRSYLSQSLNGKPHLTPDQLMGIAQFFTLTPDEIGFVLDLYHHERNTTPSLKKFYALRIEKAIKRQQDLGKRMKRKTASTEEQSLFYSNWMYGAVYTCALLNGVKTTSLIASKLGIAPALTQEIVSKLVTAGLLQKKGDEYYPLKADIHLSKESPFLPVHLRNWRDRAVEHASTHSHEPLLHYSAVYTVSKKDFESLLEHYLQVVEDTRIKCMKSKDEDEVVCFNIDWFRISHSSSNKS